MQESVRRHYLALLGIEQWLPRDEADPVFVAGSVAVGVPLAASPGLAPAVAATVAPAGIERESPAAGATVSTERREVPVDSAAKLDALMQQSGAPTPRQARAPALPAAASAAQPAAPTVSAVATERLASSLLVSDDGLLVVAAFASTDAPGLSGAEHEMLLRLAGALSPRFTAMPVDLHWPPRGARVPGLERPGAARQALQEALLTRQRQGVRDLLLLGEEMAPLLADAVARLGLTLVVAPALAAMLADPQAKRACWDLAKSLRRAP